MHTLNSLVSIKVLKPMISPLSLESNRLQITGWVGAGLTRPECVMATAKGDLYTADWRSGVAHTRADGEQQFYQAQAVDGEVLKPNGIALCRDGSFLLAHLGAERGGLFHL